MRTIGRYAVGTSLGSGGMAEVFEAFDPELRRDVALKIVAIDRRRRQARRIMREAQAQAQLSHPNVVAVYDVGEVDNEIYIAMELVRGESLRAWLKREHRPWRDVLAKFVAAAEGLVAAHEIGLVHRDFKPSNVLMTEDGMAKVADFGLAVQSQDTESCTPGESPAAAELDRRLTQTGYTFGTPLYMAPEQHHARRLDAAADQYAFCASLFEALSGEAPFRSTTMLRLAEEKERGAPTMPAGVHVPRRIVAAVRRGLDPDPRQRWPSMRALVAELERERRSWWKWSLPAIAVAGVLGIAALRDDSACDGRARADADWGPAAQERLRASIGEAPHADGAWTQLHDTLDAYANAWIDAYDEACAASESNAPDPARQCLHARWRRFVALTHAFARAGPAAVESIEDAQLEPPATCLAVGDRVAEPDAEWLAIDGLLAEAHAASVSAELDRGRELATEALSRAQAIGDRELEAEATFELGVIDSDLDRYANAVPQLERAYFLADELADHRLAALAAAKLVWTIAQGSIPDADPGRWQQHARQHLQHVDDLPTQGSVYLSLATMEQTRGEYGRAADLAQEAVAVLTEAHGELHPAVASALNNRGLALVMAGRVEEALPVLRRSAQVYEDTLGELAPRRTNPVLNIGLGLYELGRYSEAAATFDEVLELARAQPIPQPNIVGRALSNKALCLLELGDTAGALAVLQQARAQLVDTLGAQHPMVTTIDMNIALAHHMGGSYEDAVAAYERARTAQVEILGADHPQTARTEHNLGTTLNSLGEYARAAEHLRAAKATFDRALGERSELAALSTVELARAKTGLGEAEAALRLADEAHEILLATSPNTRWIVYALMYRGSALRELGRDEEARAAFDAADRKLADLPDPDPALKRDLDLERERLHE